MCQFIFVLWTAVHVLHMDTRLNDELNNIEEWGSLIAPLWIEGCSELTYGDIDIEYCFCFDNVSWLVSFVYSCVLVLVVCTVHDHLHMCYFYQTCILHVHGLTGFIWLSLLFYIKLIFVNWNESGLIQSCLSYSRVIESIVYKGGENPMTPYMEIYSHTSSQLWAFVGEILYIHSTQDGEGSQCLCMTWMVLHG